MAPKLAPIGGLKPIGGALAPIDDAVKAEARKCFDEYDENKNGMLEKTELYAAFWKLCGSEDVQTIMAYGKYNDEQFAKCDKDLSGSLSFDEFLGIYDAFQKAPPFTGSAPALPAVPAAADAPPAVPAAEAAA